MTVRTDPVGDKYFKPLRLAGQASESLFYVSGALSLAALLVSATKYPSVYAVVQVAFVVTVVVSGIISFATRLHWAPRASEKRRQDLLSDTFSVPIIHDKSTGYYNNDQTSPLRRLAASTMESSFFTNEILKHMLKLERTRTVIYVILFVIAVSWRSTELGLVGLAAQVLFGEQTMSRYLRMEWMRLRSERVFERLHVLLSTNKGANSPMVLARILEQFSDYEVAKANADIFLSERSFAELNTQLSAEWDRIRADVGL